MQKFGWDSVLSQPMRFSGIALFTPRDGGLCFHETGTLAFRTYRGDARQHYLFRPDGPAADVLFEDGRFFHRLNLAGGRDTVRHDCTPDLYEGRYRVLGPNAWTVTWRITGPRKRQVIASRLQRMGLAGGPQPSHNACFDQGEREWAAGRVRSTR